MNIPRLPTWIRTCYKEIRLPPSMLFSSILALPLPYSLRGPNDSGARRYRRKYAQYHQEYRDEIQESGEMWSAGTKTCGTHLVIP
jgi:hypothetical protein